MAKRKPVGWFKYPKIRNSNLLKIQNHFREEDKKLPMLAGDLSRAKIFDVLVAHATESISQKLRKGSSEPHVLQLLGVFRSLTEIIAYPLSKKKPSGLGATTKAHENVKVVDKVLQQLKGSHRMLTEIRITEEHRKYSSEINQIINELIEFHDRSIRKYIHSYKRDDHFLIVCGYAIDSLKSSGFSEKDVKQITREALEYFGGQGYKIYIENIDRLFKSDFYTRVHHEGDFEGEYYSSYSIEKMPKKKSTE